MSNKTKFYMVFFLVLLDNIALNRNEISDKNYLVKQKLNTLFHILRKNQYNF